MDIEWNLDEWLEFVPPNRIIDTWPGFLELHKGADGDARSLYPNYRYSWLIWRIDTIAKHQTFPSDSSWFCCLIPEALSCALRHDYEILIVLESFLEGPLNPLYVNEGLILKRSTKPFLSELKLGLYPVAEINLRRDEIRTAKETPRPEDLKTARWRLVPHTFFY
ncbi:hypothetical protein UPYG_G00331770 [Umbra pygmaea]|uniref:Uncharacterized protein n=1 Tax=Umbra pygmaea TaxID=75934 RepID=A0ABD0WBL6_UMBPY